ncbi:MAG: carbon-nitrogen hydrolase family protein [Candidatus Omnitrophica bacterium]|nr:carbon-nitrogen hydrolase family protein [Candidatus Omnitrophota bacterium]
MKNRVKIGMGQLLVEGGEPERNLARAEKMIRESAEKGCEIVLLPETFDLGWTHPSVYTLAQPIPGPSSHRLCAAARKDRIYVCAGLTEKLGDRIHNTAVLIDSQGEIVLKYHKINELTVEQPFYAIGQTLNVIDTEFGKIGVNICADNYMDGLPIGHALARMGAQIILSPSSWTVDYKVTEEDDPYKDKWIRPYSILAGLYDMAILGTTSVGYIVGGPYEGKKMVGCSLAVDKSGIIARGPFNEFAGELVIADVKIPQRTQKGTEIGEMLSQKGFNFASCS